MKMCQAMIAALGGEGGDEDVSGKDSSHERMMKICQAMIAAMRG